MHTMVSRWRTARKVPIAHVSLNQFLISTGTSGKMNAEYLVLFIQSLASSKGLRVDLHSAVATTCSKAHMMGHRCCDQVFSRPMLVFSRHMLVGSGVGGWAERQPALKHFKKK